MPKTVDTQPRGQPETGAERLERRHQLTKPQLEAEERDRQRYVDALIPDSRRTPEEFSKLDVQVEDGHAVITGAVFIDCSYLEGQAAHEGIAR